MPFVGKKYKRVSSENLDKVVEAAQLSKEHSALIQQKNAAFTITRADDHTFVLTVHAGNKVKCHTFKLNEEEEVPKQDGTKTKMVYRMEGDNVLILNVESPNGKKLEFKRVFEGNQCVLTIKPEGVDEHGKIVYEVEQTQHNRPAFAKLWDSVTRWKNHHAEKKEVEETTKQERKCDQCGNTLSDDNQQVSKSS